MSYSSSNIAPMKPKTTSGAPSYYFPLDDFYRDSGLAFPEVQVIEGVEVPEPYRQLLVHEGDMTPTLERFHEATIHLKVLRSEKRNGFYFREVVLLTDGDDKPVEFGAIKIFLDLFPLAARNDILAERLPLGTLLGKYQITHTSRPKGFLQIESDEFINRALGLAGKRILYGRRNTLSNPDGQPLAEIVEILPPTARA
jgi:chorismate-pyruvate lyase